MSVVKTQEEFKNELESDPLHIARKKEITLTQASKQGKPGTFWIVDGPCRIETFVKGKKETAQDVDVGYIAVTGHNGETYPVTIKNFNKSYEVVDEIAIARPLPKQIKIYKGPATEFEAPKEWNQADPIPIEEGDIVVFEENGSVYRIEKEIFWEEHVIIDFACSIECDVGKAEK
jgi:hypothetical protein